MTLEDLNNLDFKQFASSNAGRVPSLMLGIAARIPVVLAIFHRDPEATIHIGDLAKEVTNIMVARSTGSSHDEALQGVDIREVVSDMQSQNLVDYDPALRHVRLTGQGRLFLRELYPE